MKRSLKHYWSLGVVLAAGLFSIGQTALAGPAEIGLKITLRDCNYAQIEPETLIRAEQEAARIYRKIGVEVRWVDLPSLSEGKESELPHGQPYDIQISILPHAMAERFGLGAESFGFAPGSGRDRRFAYVFYDRIDELAQRQLAAWANRSVSKGATTAQILGAAIAHEVGHVLGLLSHSHTGIMRPKWDRNDLTDAAWERLLFAPGDAQVIRNELQIRQQADLEVPKFEASK